MGNRSLIQQLKHVPRHACLQALSKKKPIAGIIKNDVKPYHSMQDDSLMTDEEHKHRYREGYINL
ncbi:hypothetical protein SERLA73DRAFT_119430 [Serpula lacrymans var. lacrymans S7.3]|uniref:Uncharacterized protein n=1 Tax=Serpula lacrymans var. lacrymans (strain S7.3) TaxID=936435 RepID=F8PJW4_SERL3|nr:hypothetical protein SERLA73DRAFT_119430 [Serpula lacrymans var. lacrymans S7.3]